MDRPNLLPRVLDRAVRRVLAALFRVLLRHGMSYTAFELLARRVYVDVAWREFGLPGRKPSVSRASILSGLTRKEVQRLVGEPADEPEPGSERDNRAARVLSAWTRDADFLDAQGEPRVLELQDGAASFAELVRRHSGDMPVRAVLDELLHVGAVARLADGRLQLVERVFLPRRSALDKIDLLGHDVADLVATIDHNIQHGDDDPRFQRRVMYREMPASVAPAFRKLSAAQAMPLLVKLDRWLAARADDPPGDSPPVRLGLGIYYFEDHAPSAARKED